MRPFMVVELVGPLLDDRGAFLAAIGQVLEGAGVELRPGALAQAAGADLDWALRTLLEGHGRDDLLGRLGELRHRVIAAWERLVESPELRPAAGADSSWQRLAAGQPAPLVLSSLPPSVVGELERRFRWPGLTVAVVGEGDGGSGLPRSAPLAAALEAAGADPGTVLAGVASPAAVLGTVGARCGEVVQVGLPTGIGEAMPVDRFVGRIDELLPPE